MISDIDDVEPERICCHNCKWFQEDNRFCRYNPPVPINIRVGDQFLMTSMFPKVSMPTEDYCSRFECFDDASDEVCEEAT